MYWSIGMTVLLLLYFQLSGLFMGLLLSHTLGLVLCKCKRCGENITDLSAVTMGIYSKSEIGVKTE